MNQRRLKVGDIVDDYCPRERRVTDHAIVAMIDGAIRQTRCTACENEHPYKEARVPRVRRKNTPAALYQEVLADAGGTPEPPVSAAPAAYTDEPAPAAAPETEAASTAGASQTPAPEEGPVHRPLIRATLPRPEGGTPASRPLPEFTVRQSAGRGRFREDFRGGFRSGNRSGPQSAQGRPGRPGGQHQSRQRHGRPAPHKKRSR